MKIPTPRELSAHLVELETKQREINSTISEVTIEAQAVRARLDEKRPSEGNVEANSLQRLLGKKVGPDILPDAKQLPKLLAELDRLRAAQNSLYGGIRRETTAASRLVCEAIKPEHSRLAVEFANKLRELHAAHLKYVEFVDSVESAGAQIGSLGWIQPTALGHPRDTSGAYYWAFREIADAGHIDRSEIPSVLTS